ncbi:MAG: glycosyltransferase family 4 protein [Bacteroidaceae bacterium]|nr:glycosyltransferase family 4 protein [Bacteroidaceae bacterium]
MKSIVYLIAGTYRAAGMERILAGKANRLADAGYNVTIVTTDQKSRCPAYPLDPRISQTDLGISYEDSNGRSFPVKAAGYPLRIAKHWIRLSRLLKRIRPDITVSMFCNDVSFLPFINDGSRKILEAHFSRYKRLQYNRSGIWAVADRLRSAMDRIWAGRFDTFVVLTHQDAGLWGKMKNIRVIPNFTDMEFNAPVSAYNRQVLAVGRYDYQKGFDMLVKAWKLICTDGWTLRIAGQGTLPETGCKNIFTGFSENIFEEYKKSSIFALSSRYEGLPMVLLEAQAAGMPSVCFDCKCGPREIVKDGENGFLIPECDIQSFAGALKKLIDNVELRKTMGECAYRESVRYAPQNIMDLWMKMFEEQ